MSEFHSLPLQKLLPAWDEFDGCRTDLAAIRALCLVDRYYLLVRILGRVDMLHPWVYDRCREVEESPDGHLDLWGREHHKSGIITQGGAIQEVLKDQEIRIGIFSHTKGIARKFLSLIKRELESNVILKAAFEDILWSQPEKEAPGWSLDGGLIVKRKGNPKEATIEAHGLTDGQPTSAHFPLIIYDDVVTRESVNTPEQIKNTTEAWELSDNLSTINGRKWHVGTRYSYADTYEEIMKRGAVVPRLRPATDDGTITGKPVYFPQAVWNAKLLAQGESTIACQMLQNPLAGKQRMFNVEDLQTYEIRPNTLTCYVLCDPARSKKKDSANTAIVVIGLDYAGNKYLLDGFNHKMDLQERWEKFSGLYWKWRHVPGIQSVRAGYEKFGAQSDLDYFGERMKVERRSFEIVELAWPSDGDGSKVDRVQRLGPDFRGHKFFLPYATRDEALTRNQQKIAGTGHAYRIARPIKRKDGEGAIYNVGEQFKVQAHYFPFGGLKDLVDAASRIYDMEPTPPIVVDERSLEPVWT